jgi:hypothetical protein
MAVLQMLLLLMNLVLPPFQIAPLSSRPKRSKQKGSGNPSTTLFRFSSSHSFQSFLLFDQNMPY